VNEEIARGADFLLVHFNGLPIDQIGGRVTDLRKYGKPIVCNEDARGGDQAAAVARLCVDLGVSWGLMLERANQWFPFRFAGADDDPIVYGQLQRLATR
jgi:hypothetical protein